MAFKGLAKKPHTILYIFFNFSLCVYLFNFVNFLYFYFSFYFSCNPTLIDTFFLHFVDLFLCSVFVSMAFFFKFKCFFSFWHCIYIAKRFSNPRIDAGIERHENSNCLIVSLAPRRTIVYVSV